METKQRPYKSYPSVVSELDPEEWKEIPGYASFFINRNGDIRKRQKIGGGFRFNRIIAKSKGYLGAKFVDILDKKINVAFLVATAFIDGFKNTDIVKYKNKEYPFLENLEIIKVKQREIIDPKITFKLKPFKIRTDKSKCNKALYHSAKEAQTKINFLNNDRSGRKIKIKAVRHYYCDKCEGWHLTSKPLDKD